MNLGTITEYSKRIDIDYKDIKAYLQSIGDDRHKEMVFKKRTILKESVEYVGIDDLFSYVEIALRGGEVFQVNYTLFSSITDSSGTVHSSYSNNDDFFNLIISML